MIEFFFFFISWGTETKQEQLNGVKLTSIEKGQGKLFNIIYNLNRTVLFWVIPLGGWKIDSVHIQSIKTGNIFELKGEVRKEFEELYWEAKLKEE